MKSSTIVPWLADEHYSLWTIVLLFTWQFGSAMVIFLAALQGVPQSLYEAAEIDGASRWQQFIRITVPLITPVIFFNVIMQMVHAYAELWQSPIGSVNAVNILRTQPEGTDFLVNFGGKRVGKTFQGARGGEAGIVIRRSEDAPTVRLAYSIDQARLDAGGYRDSIEGLTIAIGFDTRRPFE